MVVVDLPEVGLLTSAVDDRWRHRVDVTAHLEEVYFCTFPHLAAAAADDDDAAAAAAGDRGADAAADDDVNCGEINNVSLTRH